MISVHSLLHAYATKAPGHGTNHSDCVLSKWELIEQNTAIKSIDCEIKAQHSHKAVINHRESTLWEAEVFNTAGGGWLGNQKPAGQSSSTSY